MKILITARDHGAALNIISIITALLKNNHEVIVCAQGIAYKTIIEHSVVKPIKIASDLTLNELQSLSKELLEKYQPDIILTGLSGFSIGIDEVILKMNKDAISFTLQDYWGDVNDRLNKYANNYFVIDDTAINMTEKKTKGTALVMNGLPKYTSYERLVAQFDESLKSNNKNIMKVVFLGQPLWGFDSYKRTLESLSYILVNSDNLIEFSYKTHPTETEDNKNDIRQIFHQLNFTLTENRAIEKILYESDISISINPTCAMDLLYINKYRKSGHSLHLFLLLEEDIKEFFYKNFSDKSHPLVKNNIVEEINSLNKLEAFLNQKKEVFIKIKEQNRLKADQFLDSKVIACNIERKISDLFKEKNKKVL